MATNENLDYIKEGLSAQEQILGQAIAGERFFRRHKKTIYAVLALIVLGVLAYSANNYIEQKTTQENNALYAKVLLDSNNTALVSELESKSPELFALFALSEFKNSNDVTIVDRALKSTKDSDLREILLAAKGENSKLLSDYDALINGFKELEKNNIQGAKNEFSKIPENSPLKALSNNLEHFQGIKK